MFRTLWRHRELILSLVKRDLKTRYKGSALGFFWSLCKPLFVMTILFVVFVIIVPLRLEHTYFQTQRTLLVPAGAETRISSAVFDLPQGEGVLHKPVRARLIDPAEVTVDEHSRETRKAFGIHLVIGILFWSYFAGSLSESTHSILVNANIIKKIKTPVEVFPIATVLSNLVHFLLAMVVLIPAMLLMGYKITWMVLLLPPIVILFTILIAGFAFLLSAANVFYRDVGSITEIVLMAWFYITPIFYPASVAWEQLRQFPRVFFWLFVSNPVATVVIAARRVLFIDGNFAGREVADATFWKYLALCLAVSIAVYAIGRLTFRRLSPYFADEV